MTVCWNEKREAWLGGGGGGGGYHGGGGPATRRRGTIYKGSFKGSFRVPLSQVSMGWTIVPAMDPAKLPVTKGLQDSQTPMASRTTKSISPTQQLDPSWQRMYSTTMWKCGNQQLWQLVSLHVSANNMITQVK